MSNFQIHELSTGALDRDSNIVHDSEVSGNYQTRKATAGAVADLASANVAAEYDTTATYAIGQYCLYEGDIYRCIAITTGTFDSTAWTQVVVTGEYRRVVELTSADYALLTPAEKSNGTLYIITDEDTTASDITYDNSSSGLSASNLQEAVDEVVGNMTIKSKSINITFDSSGEGAISDNDIKFIVATQDETSDGLYVAFLTYLGRDGRWKIKTISRNNLNFTSQGIISTTRAVKIYYI